jgi:hypothetical protein
MQPFSNKQKTRFMIKNNWGEHLIYPPEVELLLFRDWQVFKGGVADKIDRNLGGQVTGFKWVQTTGARTPITQTKLSKQKD